ncbi:MAG: hypothetical protein ACNA7V_01090 [Bacteroidales bacterium]
MSKQIKNNVRDYYNDHVREEDARLDKHPFELINTLTTEAIFLMLLVGQDELPNCC